MASLVDTKIVYNHRSIIYNGTVLASTPLVDHIHAGWASFVTNMRDSTPVLLYDGACGFCAESVQFVLRRDRAKTLRFAPLQSDFGRAVISRHAQLGEVDSMIWVDDAGANRPERVFTHSSAALCVMQYLGGGWRLLRVAAIVPVPVRDAVYRFIARHRHQFSRGGPQCFVPTAEERARFLT